MTNINPQTGGEYSRKLYRIENQIAVHFTTYTNSFDFVDKSAHHMKTSHTLACISSTNEITAQSLSSVSRILREFPRHTHEHPEWKAFMMCRILPTFQCKCGEGFCMQSSFISAFCCFTLPPTQKEGDPLCWHVLGAELHWGTPLTQGRLGRILIKIRCWYHPGWVYNL